MSFRNRHMLVKEAIVGLRTNVASKLDLSGITWANARKKLVSNHEYGNTKYTDLWCVINYIKNTFQLADASDEIGYSAQDKKYSGAASLSFRLKRINTSNFMEIIHEMFRVKLIDKETTRQIIQKEGHGNIARGKFYRFYTKLMITSALEKFPNMATCASKLGVEEADLQWWLDEDVENVLVSAR